MAQEYSTVNEYSTSTNYDGTTGTFPAASVTASCPLTMVQA